jgi:hypothetical protein
LDGIESSATADQTAAEIRTAVEAATDSNVFTDADHTKLNAIEALADVTDATNVTAAGALMDSELTAIASVKALNQGVATTDSPTFVNVTATSLDISGDIDVDGTTNLDVVDIDGAVDMASTLAVGGKVRVGAATDGTGALMTFDSASNSSSLQMGNNSDGISPGGVLLYSASGNEFQIYQYTGVVGSETYGNPTFALNSIGAATFTPISAGGHAVFNEGGIDADFRVESDTDTHALFVQGSDGFVGIGTSSPSRKLAVESTGVIFNNTGGTHDILFGDAAYRYFNIHTPASPDYMTIRTATTDLFTVTADGNVGIGTTGPSAKLHINQTSTSQEGGFFYSNAATSAACLRVLQDSASASGPALWVRNDGSGNAITVDDGSDGNTVFAISNAGALSKASGSFKINHPLEAKTDTHHLVHSFIEGPQADNIYRGKVDLVNGSATVNIDTVAGMTEGTFVALNREVQCFTTNEANWDAVKGSVSGNILTIESENSESTATISWLVIGERKDQHMYDTDWTDENGKVIVEPIKS